MNLISITYIPQTVVSLQQTVFLKDLVRSFFQSEISAMETLKILLGIATASVFS